MFKSKKIVLIASIGLISVMIACTEDFGALNTPPDTVTTIDPGYVFTNTARLEALYYGGGNFHWFPMRCVGSWAQHWGETSVADGNCTYYNDGQRRNEDQIWQQQYTNLLKNHDRTQTLLLEMTEGNDAAPEIRSRIAMSKIMEIIAWERLTAIFGDIPFSDAIKGFELEVYPSYDRQEDIYTTLISQLNESIDNLTPGDVTFGSADIIFQGEIDNWIRFGNSLKLRTGMRLSEADPTTAESIVTQAMNSPLISNHDESAVVATGPGGGPGFFLHAMHNWNRNPWGVRVNQTLIDVLNDFDDPRLPRMIEPTSNSKEAYSQSGDPNDLEYKGVFANAPEHILTGYDMNEISLAAMDVWAENDDGYNPPAQLLTYAHVSFLKAEAALRGWGATPAEAQGYFEEAIRAAMEMEPYMIDEADIVAYLAEHGTLSTDFDEALEQIGVQKWINHFTMNYELYFEWRRLSYPRLDPGNGGMGLTDNKIPRRAYYHSQEPSLNGENYQEAVSNQGPDNYLTRPWIDANPNLGQSVIY